MTKEPIKNLQEFLSGCIGPNKKILDVKVGPLTELGENYSSVLHKVDVKTKNEKDGKEEWLHAVAKLIPENEKAKIMCDIQVSVKKEIAMFDTILPTLQELQRELGVKDVVDYLPKLYGWRLNVHGKNDIVDDDSVILMENLKESGYINVDRFVGLDLETTHVALKDLAAFHALPIALKLKKPDVFEKKIRPYLTVHKPPHPPKKKTSDGNDREAMLIEVLKVDECLPYISKVKEILEQDLFHHIAPVEPFASISHADLWINNVMIKFENGKPVKNKIIDFQFYDYKSPARDLFFFLFTSVQKKVLEESFDDLIKFYYDHFIIHLDKLGCDTRPFGFNKFLDEWIASVPLEIKRSIIFILMVVMKKGGPSPGFYPGKAPDMVKALKAVRPEGKEKACFMVQLCGKRGWL